MKNVSVYELRTNLATYLDLVDSGEKVVVRRFKKPVAMLSPYRKEKADLRRFWGFMKDRSDETGIEFENRVRRSAAEKAWVNRYARSR